MLVLHDYLPSGNGYKARLLLSLLGRPFTLRQYDIIKGETRTPDFLNRINANGRIPVLELADGTFLAESNAIIYYLADGTAWLPGDALGRARVLQWMCFEQYSHEPNIATRRFWLHLPDGLSDVQEAQMPGKLEAGHAALQVMDDHLAGSDWFVGAGPTIADIALYAYTHVASEGAFELERFPHVLAWLDRVAGLDGYVPITQSEFDE